MKVSRIGCDTPLRSNLIRSEKLQNESSPPRQFFEFSSRILLRIFPEFFEEFSCFISSEKTETTENSSKLPAILQCQIQSEEKIFEFHTSLLESRQSSAISKRFCARYGGISNPELRGRQVLSSFPHYMPRKRAEYSFVEYGKTLGQALTKWCT